MARIVIVGPGRAGMSIGLAARTAGHEIVALAARKPLATDLAISIPIVSKLPDAEFVFIAVPDDVIGDVAAVLRPPGGAIIAHLSGRTSVDVLAPLGPKVGSLHPLMTLPSGPVGALALAGAGAAITSRSEAVASALTVFADSLGMRPFRLPDSAKDAYHAGATAASNYVVTALALAERLFAAAGVPLEAAKPLVGAAVANVFELGALEALTGPIVRGDVDTVAAQRAAARQAEVEDSFVALGRATALLAGTWETVGEALT